MKKIISIVLAVIMMVSAFAILTNAETTNLTDSVTVYFVKTDSIDGKGDIITSAKAIVPKSSNKETFRMIAKANEYDSYVVTEGEGEDAVQVKYYFSGWYDRETGKVLTSEGLAVPTADKTYYAVFEPDYEAENGITLLSFFADFFARFNRILEYIYEIFFVGLN